jgi:serine/threonine-protein kinase RsbW
MRKSQMMEKSLNISSKIDNLRVVEKLIDEISTECNLSSEIYGNILIATLEATNNAIMHGNKLDEGKLVNIFCSFDQDELVISVTDQGKGFDYHNIPDPTAPENIENINGRGVFLMEKLSDKISFFDNGSKVELTFKV